MKPKLKILFKYPSRGRRERFEEGMKSIFDNIYDQENYHILVTADNDDAAMIYDIDYPSTTVIYGTSKSKIDAVNRDIDKVADDWDIIVCMSDDMRFNMYGFDELIREQFLDGDLDKLIHIPDQDAATALAVMYIAGKTYYNRFGFIYNPVYESLFCDNEAHEIAVKLGKYYFVNVLGVILHLNPAYNHLPKDDMFIQQQDIGWTKDQQTYLERKARNFDL